MRHSEVVLVNAPLDDGWRKRIRRMGIDDNTVFFAKSFLIGTGEHRNLSILTYYIGRDKTKQTAVGCGRLPLKLRRGRGGINRDRNYYRAQLGGEWWCASPH
jgi:hypothetical protein